jgi:hypothetical protein
MRDAGSNPLRDISVSIADPFVPACQLRTTDASGYVVAPARFRQSACSDNGSANQAFYRIVPVSPSGQNCSFTSAVGTGHAICPQSEVVSGNTTAVCPPITPPPASGNVIYELEVMNSQNQGVPGIEFYGNESFETLTNRISGGDGRYRFETRLISGANAGTRFSIIPVSQDYMFVPNIIDTKSMCSLIGGGVYRCRITAIRSSAAQGALRVRVQQSGANLQGVTFARKAVHGCGSSGSMVSDKNGIIVLPILRQQSCSDADSNSWNDFIPLIPNLTGKSFSHSSSTPFKVCPTQLVNDATIQANDDNLQNRYFNVQAKVINPAGTPLADIPLFDGPNQLGRTDSLGNFIATVQQGSKLSLEAKATPFSFDPLKLELVDLSRNIEALTFTAVLPVTDDIGVTPPDNNYCPPSPDYIVSGIVRDLSGNPLIGASIFNNNGEAPVAFSDQNGRFAIQIAALSDAWITVESGSKLFSPAGFSFPNISCNQAIEFNESTLPDVVLIGQVTSSGLPLVGAQVHLAIDGAPALSTVTNDNGLYTLSAPVNSLYSLTVSMQGYNFSPDYRSNVAEFTETDLDFVGTVIPPPSPSTPVPPTQTPVSVLTAVSTATTRPTNTPAAQPTVATAVPTTAFTFSPVPTASRTPTLVPSSSATMAPQPTQTNPSPSASPTRSVTPSRTATRAPSTSPTPPSNTHQPAPSATRTSAPTASATATRSPTPSVTPSRSPTITSTPEVPPQVSLVQSCSESGAPYQWQLTNTSAATFDFTWNSPSTGQGGSARLSPNGKLNFTTNSFPAQHSVRISFLRANQSAGGDIEIKVADPSLRCITPSPTFTPQPIATTVATRAPTQVPVAPSAIPSNAPTQAPAQTQIPQPTTSQPTQPPGAGPTIQPTQPLPPPPCSTNFGCVTISKRDTYSYTINRCSYS